MNALQLFAVARIYSGFTVMGTRAQGHKQRVENKVNLLLSASSLNLEVVSKP